MKYHIAISSLPVELVSNNLDICPSCDNSVKKGEKGVSCDECQQWWHAKCSKFSDEQYTWLEENISIRFLCKECTKKPKSSAKGGSIQL